MLGRDYCYHRAVGIKQEMPLLPNTECLKFVFGNSSFIRGNTEWRRLHKGKRYALYASPNIIRVTKLKKLKWTGHVARMGGDRCVQGLGGET
jgi:hypothetical protein